ncbi:unnamed protein product [Linum trigynum]|uniref:Uncharacterized protein n=1 Tax=Linum trigynum TaxID=586398 RepID=A0AAV2GDW4_9ROSI
MRGWRGSLTWKAGLSPLWSSAVKSPPASTSAIRAFSPRLDPTVKMFTASKIYGELFTVIDNSDDSITVVVHSDDAITVLVQNGDSIIAVDQNSDAITVLVKNGDIHHCFCLQR